MNNASLPGGIFRRADPVGPAVPEIAASILIVSSEFHSRKLLEILLRPQGYLPLSVANADEALAAISQKQFDLILLDIVRPELDGYQLARQLKASPQSADIPIIMITPLLDANARLSGLAAGAEEFLSNPVDRAELWLRVRNLLRLKAYGHLLRQHGILQELPA